MNSARAGWAEMDITPPLGLPMGGRGPRFTPGVQVLDPLCGQALVLEDGQGRRLLWVSLDMIGLSYTMSSLFRYEMAAISGIPYDSIVLNFSHTHSGPMTGFEGYATEREKPAALQDYELDLIPRTARLVLQAIERLQSVTVRVHRGQSHIGINRRRRDAAGQMGMGPNPDGVYNPELWVLDIAAQEGDERCVVFNYGCHPVIVYGYAYDSISADYPGVCRRRLKDELGAAVHTQFIQGLAGNVRPRQLADLDAGVFRKAQAGDAEAVGEALAADVIGTLTDPGEEITLELAAVGGLALAPKDQGAIEPLEYWSALAQSDDELPRNTGRYWSQRLQAGLPPVVAMPWALGLMRLAKGHCIAWLAGEILAEWQAVLRQCLNDEQLLVWGYCQDGRGYMPTDALLGEGGYELHQANAYNTMGPGPFAVGIEEAARRAFADLARRLEP
ncbi:MAG: hypothetical protein GKR89_13745 [Candidatus Latescibacteria bacterium]|nr:hypothetical protein [Candidatus Latescibacterota bacterium]